MTDGPRPQSVPAQRPAHPPVVTVGQMPAPQGVAATGLGVGPDFAGTPDPGTGPQALAPADDGLFIPVHECHPRLFVRRIIRAPQKG